MDSGMIGKVAKAHRYAEEKERFRFVQLQVTVHGDNDDHTVALDGDTWTCSCEFFDHHGACAHTMSLEVMLENMLPRSVEFAVAS